MLWVYVSDCQICIVLLLLLVCHESVIHVSFFCHFLFVEKVGF